MRVLHVNPQSPDPRVIEVAATILRGGGLVAFPTETVYGLGANALSADAVARIFVAKGRPSYNPLIVHVADENAARALAAEWPDAATRLARAFWPGPLTLVLEKRDMIPDNVTAGLDSVALRVPAHPVALALLRAAGVPLAAPSANRSTELSPTTAEHVVGSLGNRAEIILDGGPTDVGIESTVVDLRGARPAILRPGMIGLRELAPIVGELDVRGDVRGEAPRPAPGMLDRHYAPRARLVLFAPPDVERIAVEAGRVAAEGGKAGALIIGARLPIGSDVLEMPSDAARYGQRLYAALHTLDERGVSVIFVERVPHGDEWSGVRDRLERASRPAE